MGQHRSASASRLLGLDGLEIPAAEITSGEWQLEVQTMAPWPAAPAAGCGTSCTAAARSGYATCQSNDVSLPMSLQPGKKVGELLA